MFIFWVAKGGFNRKFLYTDNIILTLVSSLINVGVYEAIDMPLWVMTPVICGFTVLVLFIGLFFYRFFRNPTRNIPGSKNDIVSPADGRIIYIKELESNQIPVTVKTVSYTHLTLPTKRIV